MYSVTKGIHISFAHHIRGHAGSCINIHGHTWLLEVDVQSETLDGEGFVVDFRRIKSDVLQPVYALLDHALAVGEKTFADIETGLAPIGVALLNSRTDVHGPDADLSPSAGATAPLAGARNAYPGGMKIAVFPFSPTSETLAKWLYDLASHVLDDDRVRVTCARVYETLQPTQSVAEYRPS